MLLKRSSIAVAFALLVVFVGGCARKQPEDQEIKRRLDEIQDTIRTELWRSPGEGERTIQHHVDKLKDEVLGASKDSREERIALGVLIGFVEKKARLLQEALAEAKLQQITDFEETKRETDFEYWARKNLSQLNLLLEKLKTQIQSRDRRLAEMEKHLKHFRRDPMDDKEYLRAKMNLGTLRDQVESLRKLREETYLSALKSELLCQPAEKEAQLKQLMRTALAEVEKHRSVYDQMVNSPN